MSQQNDSDTHTPDSGDRIDAEVEARVDVGSADAPRSPATSPIGEVVWAVAQSRDDDWDSWFLALPRPEYERAMKEIDTYECTTWGELRATADPETYRDLCEMFDYDPDEPPAERTEENRDLSFGPPPPDDDWVQWGIFDSSFGPDVFALMCETLPTELFAHGVEVANTMFEGFKLEVHGSRAPEVLADLRAAGIELTEQPSLIYLLRHGNWTCDETE